MRPTDAWIERYVIPRLTFRDKEIIEFVHNYRIVTSDQLARTFWFNCSNAQRLCNRRLQILIELRCLNGHYPLTPSGKAHQHLVLDSAGAKVLGLEKWRKIGKLPLTYQHQILTTEFAIKGKQHGLEGGIVEYLLGPVRADLFYPGRGLAIEIDTGTSSHHQLIVKAQRYRRVKVNHVVMVTTGPTDRLKTFLGTLGYGTGARYDQLDKLLRMITP